MASWTDRTALVRAPDLDIPGVTWLNVPAALSLTALRGKLAILDFWTLGCINCIHLAPILRHVEEAFPDPPISRHAARDHHRPPFLPRQDQAAAGARTPLRPG